MWLGQLKFPRFLGGLLNSKFAGKKGGFRILFLTRIQNSFLVLDIDVREASIFYSFHPLQLYLTF